MAKQSKAPKIKGVEDQVLCEVKTFQYGNRRITGFFPLRGGTPQFVGTALIQMKDPAGNLGPIIPREFNIDGPETVADAFVVWDELATDATAKFQEEMRKAQQSNIIVPQGMPMKPMPGGQNGPMPRRFPIG